MLFYSVGGPALPCCYMNLSVQAGKKCSQVVSAHIFYSVGGWLLHMFFNSVAGWLLHMFFNSVAGWLLHTQAGWPYYVPIYSAGERLQARFLTV
jgi:hypothetical protein